MIPFKKLVTFKSLTRLYLQKSRFNRMSPSKSNK